MVIYKTTNLINGKIYIGKDEKNNPKYLGSGKILKLAIKKYGKENFKKEILEYCNNREHLCVIEKYWIEKLQSKKNGYNIKDGGNGGHTYIDNEEIKCKISKNHADINGEKNPMFGKKHSEESKKKMSINTKKCFEQNPELIEKLRKRMKEKSKGRNNPNYNPTPVLQYDMNMNFIKKWDDLYSLKENGFNSKLISQCCMGRYKKSHGFIWKFK